MAYAPKIHVIDLRPVAGRVLAYIEATQVEAFTWIGQPNLPPIKKFYSSVAGRLSTVFPHLMIVSKELATKPADHIEAAAEFRFQMVIAGGNTDALVAQSEQYAFAVASMLSNLPHGTFDNTSEAPNVKHQPFALESIDTVYDELQGATNNADAFFQIVLFRTIYRLMANVSV